MPRRIAFYQKHQKPTRTTCRIARGLLLEEELAFDFRDLDKQCLTGAELDELIGERDHKEFSKHPQRTVPQTQEAEAPFAYRSHQTYGQRTQSDPTPLLIRGSQILFGFDQA